MQVTAKLLREAGQLAFIAGVILAMTICALLCALGKDESPL